MDVSFEAWEWRGGRTPFRAAFAAAEALVPALVGFFGPVDGGMLAFPFWTELRAI